MLWLLSSPLIADNFYINANRSSVCQEYVMKNIYQIIIYFVETINCQFINDGKIKKNNG